MAELVQLFVKEMDARVGALRDAMALGDADQLRAMVRRLKGAAGGYGFPEISDRAARVEETALAGQAQTSGLTEQVEELIQLCRRATA
jgi:HPt (histidine-containing phosphotransfer) domain-containing protein